MATKDNSSASLMESHDEVYDFDEETTMSDTTARGVLGQSIADRARRSPVVLGLLVTVLGAFGGSLAVYHKVATSRANMQATTELDDTADAEFAAKHHDGGKEATTAEAAATTTSAAATAATTTAAAVATTEKMQLYAQMADDVYSDSKYLADFQGDMTFEKCAEYCTYWPGPGNHCNRLCGTENTCFLHEKVEGTHFTKEESCTTDCFAFNMHGLNKCTLFSNDVDLVKAENDNARGIFYARAGTKIIYDHDH